MNYPDQTDLSHFDDDTDIIQDDVARIFNKHAELMACIREMMRPIYELNDLDVTNFLITVDEAYGDLMAATFSNIEEKHGISINRPISPEYATWLCKRKQIQNPQTLIDVAAANAAAAASVLDLEALS